MKDIFKEEFDAAYNNYQKWLGDKDCGEREKIEPSDADLLGTDHNSQEHIKDKNCEKKLKPCRADLSYTDLRGLDFRGTDLRGAYIRNADLCDADLRDADFRGVDFRGTKFRGTKFRGTDFRGADLRDTDLCHVDFRGINFSGPNLSGANLSGADLSGADLRDINLSGANLSGANLFDTNLFGANLSGAYLSGANLFGTYLSGTNLSGANLSGANLYSVDLSSADLSGANFANTQFADTNLYRANFSGAKLRNTTVFIKDNRGIWGKYFKNDKMPKDLVNVAGADFVGADISEDQRTYLESKGALVSEPALVKIDYDLAVCKVDLKKYEEDLKKYEEDLEKCKEDSGKIGHEIEILEKRKKYLEESKIATKKIAEIKEKLSKVNIDTKKEKTRLRVMFWVYVAGGVIFLISAIFVGCKFYSAIGMFGGEVNSDISLKTVWINIYPSIFLTSLSIASIAQMHRAQRQLVSIKGVIEKVDAVSYISDCYNIIFDEKSELDKKMLEVMDIFMKQTMIANTDFEMKEGMLKKGDDKEKLPQQEMIELLFKSIVSNKQ